MWNCKGQQKITAVTVRMGTRCVDVLVFDRRWALPVQPNVSRSRRHASERKGPSQANLESKLTGKSPPIMPTISVLIGLISINQFYSKRRQQQRHTGAEELVTKSNHHHHQQEKNTRSDKMHGLKRPIWLSVRRFSILGFCPKEVFRNTIWISWRSSVRASVLVFSQLAAIPGMANWANLAG